MATSSASLDRSPRSNWVEESGGLPPGIRKVARAIKKRNPSWSLERCIATAQSMSKKWAAKGSVKGARNVAGMQALRARNKARMAAKTVTASNPALDGLVLHLSNSYGLPVTVPQEMLHEQPADVLALADADMRAALDARTRAVFDLAQPAQLAQWLDLAERRVRTPSGVARYKKPIGSIITRTASVPRVRTGADFVRSAQKASATRQAKVSAAADRVAGLDEKTRAGVLGKATPQQLAAMDKEFTRRAAALGKPGQVSAAHKAVKDARGKNTPAPGQDRLANLTPAQRDAVLAARAKRAQASGGDLSTTASASATPARPQRGAAQKAEADADVRAGRLTERERMLYGTAERRDAAAARVAEQNLRAKEQAAAEAARPKARVPAAAGYEGVQRQLLEADDIPATTGPSTQIRALQDAIKTGQPRYLSMSMANAQPRDTAPFGENYIKLNPDGTAVAYDRRGEVIKTQNAARMQASVDSVLRNPKPAAARSAREDASAAQRAANDRQAAAMGLPGADGGRPQPDMSNPQDLSDAALDQRLNQAKTALRKAFEADPRRSSQTFKDAKMNADVLAAEKRRRNGITSKADQRRTAAQQPQQQGAKPDAPASPPRKTTDAERGGNEADVEKYRQQLRARGLTDEAQIERLAQAAARTDRQNAERNAQSREERIFGGNGARPGAKPAPAAAPQKPDTRARDEAAAQFLEQRIAATNIPEIKAGLQKQLDAVNERLGRKPSAAGKAPAAGNGGDLDATHRSGIADQILAPVDARAVRGTAENITARQQARAAAASQPSMFAGTADEQAMTDAQVRNTPTGAPSLFDDPGQDSTTTRNAAESARAALRSGDVGDMQRALEEMGVPASDDRAALARALLRLNPAVAERRIEQLRQANTRDSQLARERAAAPQVHPDLAAARQRSDDRRQAEETQRMGGTRGLGAGANPAESATVAGMQFQRTTNPRESVNAETYTSADGTVTLHQSRQDGTWLARERGKGSMGFQRHADPAAALAEVTDRRGRENAVVAAREGRLSNPAGVAEMPNADRRQWVASLSDAELQRLAAANSSWSSTLKPTRKDQGARNRSTRLQQDIAAVQRLRAERDPNRSINTARAVAREVEAARSSTRAIRERGQEQMRQRLQQMGLPTVANASTLDQLNRARTAWQERVRRFIRSSPNSPQLRAARQELAAIDAVLAGRL